MNTGDWSHGKQAASFDAATEAVEVWLDLGGFIDDHKSQICERLEACEKLARETTGDADLTFFAEGLPAIDSIIRVGSSRTRLDSATQRIREDWPDTDPLALLSMLTFRYIVGKRRDLLGSSLNDQEKHAIWEEISKRVEPVKQGWKCNFSVNEEV